MQQSDSLAARSPTAICPEVAIEESIANLEARGRKGERTIGACRREYRRLAQIRAETRTPASWNPRDGSLVLLDGERIDGPR